MKPINKNLTRLVELLGDQKFHDGESLGRRLNVTRSAVWKIIKKLQTYGVSLESAKGKGYLLTEPLILLSAGQIQKILPHQVNLEIFESIGSTNDYLKKQAASTKPQWCLAEQQTKGRGRFDRYWYSPFGENIYLSCRHPIQKDISRLAGLSQVVSLAVLQALTQYFEKCHPETQQGGLSGVRSSNFKIKWPNDILYKNEKLSGVLIEIQAESHGISQAIIGIGLNVNSQKDLSGKITKNWTSLRKITAQYIDRNQIAALLINALTHYMEKFKESSFSAFMDEWKAKDYLLGKEIELLNANIKVKGKVMGVDAQGCLLLKENGQVKSYSSGETTIKL